MIFNLVVMVLLAAQAAAQSSTPPAAQPHSIGVSSCMAAACHGRPQADDTPAWQSSYTVWATQDPHSDAFARLFSDRSQAMVRILHGGETSPAAHRQIVQERCVGCHAAASESGMLLTQGVSCEACHGPASEWVEPHTGASWLATSSEIKTRYGQTDTLDLFSRAAVCASCHVGGRRSDDRTYDVNHDLIAAGHPRLAFEFSAYLAQLPAHWDRQRDRLLRDKRQTQRADFDTEAWVAGQLSTSLASLSLLPARTKHVWPEFAESDCYACHQGLRPRVETMASATGNPGRPAWNTWQMPMLKFLALESDNRQLWEPLQLLEAKMSASTPAATTVAELAAGGTAAIEQLHQQLKQTPLRREKLLAGLSRQAGNWRNWDEAAQWYLAVAALAGIYDSGQATQQQRSALDAVRQCLEKPLESPSDTLYDFDPQHPKFKQAVAELVEQLK